MVEYWMTIATYYLGAVLFSVLVSNLSAIIMSKNISARNFEERMQVRGGAASRGGWGGLDLYGR